MNKIVKFKYEDCFVVPPRNDDNLSKLGERLSASPPAFPLNIRQIKRHCEEGGTTTEAIFLFKSKRITTKKGRKICKSMNTITIQKT